MSVLIQLTSSLASNCLSQVSNKRHWFLMAGMPILSVIEISLVILGNLPLTDDRLRRFEGAVSKLLLIASGGLHSLSNKVTSASFIPN